MFALLKKCLSFLRANQLPNNDRHFKKWYFLGVSGTEVETLLGVLIPHIRVPGFEEQLPFEFRLPSNAASGGSKYWPKYLCPYCDCVGPD